jgi:hypothetical protein
VRCNSIGRFMNASPAVASDEERLGGSLALPPRSRLIY